MLPYRYLYCEILFLFSADWSKNIRLWSNISFSAWHFIIVSIFSEQQQKMSKYCVSDICCQNKELNSLSHHNCYLLALVADYDGRMLISDDDARDDGNYHNTDNHGDDDEHKGLGGFFKGLYCVDIQDRLFAPISSFTLKRIPDCY